jgi:large repetitive protein
MRTYISFLLLMVISGLSPGPAHALYPVRDGFRVYSTVITASNGVRGVQAAAVLPLDTDPLSDSYNEARIIIGGSFQPAVGALWQNLVRLLSDGSRDSTFNVTVNGPVSAIAVQPDGSTVIGGSFTNVSTAGGSKPRRGLARLDASGILDDFNPLASATAASVKVIALQKDASGNLMNILAGGSFQGLELNKLSLVGISPDGTYLPASATPGSPGFGDLDGEVNAILLQGSNRIIVAGNFTQPRANIARFQADPAGSYLLDSLFTPAPGGAVLALAAEANGNILVGGDFPTFLVRYQSDGTPLPFSPLPQGPVTSLVVQPDGCILASETLASPTSTARLVRFEPYGAASSFAPPGFNGAVHFVALQPDGKILAGGEFSAAGPGAAQAPRVALARFYPGGALDDDVPERNFQDLFDLGDGTFFDIGALVDGIALQPDGRINIVGAFNTVLGKGWRDYVRFNEDWSLDDSQPALSETSTGEFPLDLSVLKDQSVLIGSTKAGSAGLPVPACLVGINPSGAANSFDDLLPACNFTGVMGSVVLLEPGGTQGKETVYLAGDFGAKKLLRLKKTSTPDGRIILENDGYSIDSSLIPGKIHSIAIQRLPDLNNGFVNWILIGTDQGYLLRLNPDSSDPARIIDPTWQFTTQLVAPFGPGAIFSIALDRDGNILVGGDFDYPDTDPDNPDLDLLRLTKKGILDTSFKVGIGYDPPPGGIPFGSFVTSIALQTDGSILIGGLMSFVRDRNSGTKVPRNSIARLFPDGVLDPGFDVGEFTHLFDLPTSTVSVVKLQPDGKVVVGGDFADLNHTGRHTLARFNNKSATQLLQVDSPTHTISWLRQGTGPELWLVYFEYLDETATPPVWNLLGFGSRTAARDGWQCDLSRTFPQGLPSGTRVRARGYTVDGTQGGGSLIESDLYYYPQTTIQPQSIDLASATCIYGVPCPSLKVTISRGSNAPAAWDPDGGIPVDFSSGGNSTGSGGPLSVTDEVTGRTIATIDSRGTISVSDVGSGTITASQPGDSLYAPATSGLQTLTVVKACQEITFPQPGDMTFGDPPSTILATACNGLAVSFGLDGSDPGVAILDADSHALTILGAGKVVITASLAGSGQLEGAPQVVRTLIIAKKSQSIDFAALPAKSRWDPPFTLGASASSGLALNYRSSDESVAEIAGNTVVIKGAGTAVISAWQAGNANFNAALPSARPLTVAEELVPPRLSLSALSSGAVTANPVLNLTGVASDASGIASLTVNGTDLTAQAGLFSCAIPLAAGHNSIEVSALDGAGNRATQSLAITFDAAAPEILLSAPADNSVTDQPLFSAVGTVPPGAVVSLALNGGQPQPLTVVNGRFTGSTILQEGVNTIEFSAVSSGRGSRVKRSVTLASAGPVLAILEPAEDLRTELAGVTIRGAAGSGAASLTLEAAGSSYAPPIQGGSFQQGIVLDHPGAYQITARIRDAAGRVSTVRRNIIRVPVILGDLNGDGLVDLRDGAQALRISLGMEQATPQTLAHGDVAPLVDGALRPDGVIDSGDVLLLLRKIIGLMDF